MCDTYANIQTSTIKAKSSLGIPTGSICMYVTGCLNTKYRNCPYKPTQSISMVVFGIPINLCNVCVDVLCPK